jgi:hypothetical protein
MPTYRVSLGFAQMPDTALDDFAGAVITGLTGNAAFPAPLVTVAELTTLKTAFEQALANAAQGGTAATAAKNSARDALVAALRKDANYVEMISDQNLSTLLTSGYESTSTNRQQTILEKVQITGIENPQSGQLKARINPVPNARGFDGRIKTGAGDWGPIQSFANSKSIVFKDLTPGTVYTIEIRGVGGSTGTGDWSDPVSHMAT